MITEATIENVLQGLAAGPDRLEAGIEQLAERQPELLNYLSGEDTQAFTEAEHDLLLYTALSIYLSVGEERGEPAPVSGEQLAAAEELSYERLAGRKGSFSERVTPFFEDSEEEELLALVEDMSLSEEVTGEAREAFFVTLATVVEVLA